MVGGERERGTAKRTRFDRFGMSFDHRPRDLRKAVVGEVVQREQNVDGHPSTGGCGLVIEFLRTCDEFLAAFWREIECSRLAVEKFGFDDTCEIECEFEMCHVASGLVAVERAACEKGVVFEIPIDLHLAALVSAREPSFVRVP